MKNLIIKSALLLFMGAGLFSCKKEIQDEAPAEQTTTKDLGNGIIETLQRGPNGTNVIFSNWITKTQADWNGIGTPEIQTDINTTSLTDAIKNQGIVLVYFDFAGRVYLLPFVQLQFNYEIDNYFTTGKITLSLRVVGGGTIAEPISDMKFRYVLIPNSAFPGSGNGKMSKPVDYTNYNAVCEYYGIAK